MPEPKPRDGDYCPSGELREVRERRPTGNEGSNAKASKMLTNIEVEMGDPSEKFINRSGILEK